MPHTTTTEDFARLCGVRPNTIRTRYCRTGSYFGVRPVKLSNGRLLWPDDGQHRLEIGGGNHP